MHQKSPLRCGVYVSLYLENQRPGSYRQPTRINHHIYHKT
jgi:hypothetical protein